MVRRMERQSLTTNAIRMRYLTRHSLVTHAPLIWRMPGAMTLDGRSAPHLIVFMLVMYEQHVCHTYGAIAKEILSGINYSVFIAFGLSGYITRCSNMTSTCVWSSSSSGFDHGGDRTTMMKHDCIYGVRIMCKVRCMLLYMRDLAVLT